MKIVENQINIIQLKLSDLCQVHNSLELRVEDLEKKFKKKFGD